MTPTQSILDSIENRLRELNEEIRTLEAARGALGRSSATPTESGRTRTAGRRTRAATATNGASAEAAEPPAKPARMAPAKPARVASTKPAPAASTTRTRKPAGSSQRGKRRSTKSLDVVPAGKLEVLLAESDGLTTSDLAGRAGGDRDQVLTLLRELEASGRIRRTGQRRATRWHAITDEDRIRERAAELAARSRSAA